MSNEFTVEIRVNEYVYRGDRDDKMLVEGFTVRAPSLTEVVEKALDRLAAWDQGETQKVDDAP